MNNKLLLHCCCAPCAAYSIKFLKEQGYDVTLFFYNPNIFPKEEYGRRLSELEKFAQNENYQLIIQEADFENWRQLIWGYESEPEKGKRCFLCYQTRLAKTAQKAQELNYDYFTTTLSISPHKSYEMIKEISTALENQLGINYLDVNLKKNDGYKKSVALSKEYGFYRQDYCGCEFSKIARENSKKI